MQPTNSRRFWAVSLPGVLTILHLSVWLGLILMHAMLSDTSGTLQVNSSNRFFVDLLEWIGIFASVPLFLLLRFLDGPDPLDLSSVSVMVGEMVLNSVLVGFGLAGAIRKIAKRQFYVRSLFGLTLLTAVILSTVRLERFDLVPFLLFTGILVLLWLGLENIKLPSPTVEK